VRNTGRAAPRKLFISSDETALIKYQIELVARPAIVKAGLQRLCGHLESGLYLTDIGSFRNTIVGLVFTGQSMVRRWAYKALAHIGQKTDIKILSDRMRSESDPENLTWIMSAIFGLSRSSTVLEVCRESGAEYSDAMALAALLYGKDAIARIGSGLPQIDVETADPLTLKWCAILAGYGKAPPNLIDPHYENKALLGVLNGHDASEVAEYSVWALWRSAEFSVEDLQIPQGDFLTRPENVRRWTNRLIAKDPRFLAQNLDLFDDLYEDESLKAREGLALGIRDVHMPELEPHVLRWLGRETEADLKELILEHMATSESADADVFDMLYESYSSASVGGSLRRRLRAAVSSRGGKLFQAFNRLDATSFMLAGSASLFADEPRAGAITVSNTINVGRDLNAQNVAGGDLVAIANDSVQKLKHQDAEVAEVLEQIIALTKEQNAFDPQQSAQLLAAVDNVAKEPTASNKGKLLETLKLVASGVSVASAATKIPALITTVSAWL
jgi:hypothetical protein